MKIVICVAALIALIHSAHAFRIAAGECTIDVSALKPAPIFSVKSQFIYPKHGEKEIKIAADQAVEITCSGGKIEGVTPSVEATTATCVSGTKFKIDNKEVNIHSIKCSRFPFHTARYTKNLCEGAGKEAEIGFVKNKEFVQQIRICFDTKTQEALYSHYHLTASIGAHEHGVERISFIQDDFYQVGDRKVNDLYERAGQRDTINELLGLPKTSKKYIQDGAEYFLSRGHFSAKADFVYGNQQRATFHYVNVAPQWQTFNGKNWNEAEMQVRDYADAKNLDLEVYTGPYGVTTLPHEQTKKQTALYLYVDAATGAKALPVPDLYWKLVYHAESKKAVVILGVNNPYKSESEIKESSIICTDVLPKLTWLKFNKTLADGYMFACDYKEIKEKIQYVPNLDVSGGLLE